MNNKKLKVGIVGCGGIFSSVHFPYYIDNPEVEIVAFCDIILSRAEGSASRIGLPASVCYESYEEMLEKVELDAIDICTPNYLHSIIAVAALNKGIHVFCEKPDAVSVAEAMKMKDAAEKNGKHLMVMRNNRYNDYSKFLKKYIADGKMGEIYTARAGWHRRRGIPGKGGWFTTKAQSGGGPLIDLGVHMIDLAIWLMGNPKPVSVTGATYRKFADNDAGADSAHAKFGDAVSNGTFDVEDLAFGFIRFDNGCTMQIEFSWASNIEYEKNYIDLRGTKAGATNDTRDGRFKIFTEENGVTVDYVPNLAGGEWGHVQNLRHFYNVVLGKEEPDFVPEQGVNMVRILEAMYKSAELGEEVKL
ncbi:MAG: Gfo/Idh/MocA family oxidoreductase [Ruminococcaceae bacterium]|nr:Gfo/Idh/MocA family oxidoreductase [Oscillospiraceae bacterium]